jgi:hypothetical protein
MGSFQDTPPSFQFNVHNHPLASFDTKWPLEMRDWGMIPGVVFWVLSLYRIPLKMEAAKSSETFIIYQITTWRHNPEECDLNL